MKLKPLTEEGTLGKIRHRIKKKKTVGHADVRAKHWIVKKRSFTHIQAWTHLSGKHKQSDEEDKERDGAHGF